MRDYPKGTKFGNYFLAIDQGQPVIRRQITLPDGTRQSPRYPRSKYSQFTSQQELEQLIDRLNYRADAQTKRAIEVRTAFIPTALLEEFRAQLSLEIPTEKDFRYQYKTVLHRYFLDFFVNKLGLLDPNQWHQNQSKWGAALLGESDDVSHHIFGSKSMSYKTITRSIQIANRFMNFLHIKNPVEYRAYLFEPISRAALKSYNAKAKLKNKNTKDTGKYIPAAEWLKIKKQLPMNLAPFVNLMYHYGLRRAESLGFESIGAVRKGHLRISQQLTALKEVPVYAPLKSRLERTTPHWNCTPIEACDWITESLKHKMHPDTLSLEVETLMLKLYQSKEISAVYHTHDFRRTFITNALRKHDTRDIQLAVGHSSLDTTMGYAMDDRDNSDESFDPTA